MLRKLLLLLTATIALGGVAAPQAVAKGETGGSPEGVVAPGFPFRFVAISPRAGDDLTVVEKIDLADGRVVRWWSVPGRWFVPAVAYDGSGGGLSTDGRTLVLGRFDGYAPRRTRLAILDTDLYLNHPRLEETHRPLHAIARITLPGDYAFDAISPDGSTVYLIHYLQPLGSGAYEVRALDTASGRLRPDPIVDPAEAGERMSGLPISRAMSPDGRWAYTLYDGNGKEPFVHALDTVRGRAVCVDVPQLKRMVGDLFLLRLETQGGGSRLAVTGRPSGWGPMRALLTVDTSTFAVSRPGASDGGSSGGGSSALPAIALGLGLALAAGALLWRIARRRGPGRRAMAQR